jgi:nucleoid DNA-binding protein
VQDNIKSLLAQKLSEKTHKDIKDSQQLVDLFFELISDKNQFEEIKN